MNHKREADRESTSQCACRAYKEDELKGERGNMHDARRRTLKGKSTAQASYFFTWRVVFEIKKW